MVGGSAVDPSTFAKMVGGSAVDPSTFAKVVGGLAVDTFAKVVGGSAVGPSALVAPHQEHDQLWIAPERLTLLDHILPIFCYETMYCLKQMIKRAFSNRFTCFTKNEFISFSCDRYTVADPGNTVWGGGGGGGELEGSTLGSQGVWGGSPKLCKLSLLCFSESYGISIRIHPLYILGRSLVCVMH